MLKWLPREDASNFDVTVGMAITRNRIKAIRCKHLMTTSFSVMDRMSDNMQVYVGQVCVDCGRIGQIEKRD